MTVLDLTSQSSSQPNPVETRPTRTMDPSGRSNQSFSIVILGGGEAGLTVLQALSQMSLAPRTALIEPSSYHYDQSAWVSVGTEGMEKEETRSEEVFQVPSEVTWYRDRVLTIDPGARTVTLDSGMTVDYNYLVVALGTHVQWDRIRGLKKNLGQHGICSVYGYEQAERTWDMIRTFEGGRALFTAPSTPFKGGSAPVDLLLRAETVWKEAGIRDKTELFFTTGAPEKGASNEYAELIERSNREEGTHVFPGYDLLEVRPDSREAVFSVTKGQSLSQDVLRYDLIHVVPPMRPPTLLEDSDLAHRQGPMKGYLNVSPDSFRHVRYSTVFGVGDVLGLAGEKTRERAREQASTVAQNLKRLIDAEE